MDEVCYPLQAVCQDYQKPSEVCAHHRYYFLQQREEKTSTVSYHASSICGFTSSTEEVTHYSIRMALSPDHSNLILLEPVLSYRSPRLCTAEYEGKKIFHVHVKRMSFGMHEVTSRSRCFFSSVGVSHQFTYIVHAFIHTFSL